MNDIRCRHLIKMAIDTFELNLSGFVVLTEAATGYYMLTPLIGAIAGADKVLALTRDSHYGTAQIVCEKTLELAKKWDVDNKIDVLFSREDKSIGDADIVTNLGFVRPLNASFLSRLKRGAVIPLMWETWEYRADDLDLDECRRLGIPVLGTNEQHPNLRIFEYIGHLALKLLFELEIEVFRSRLVILGSGKFADNTLVTLVSAGSEVTRLSTKPKGSIDSTAARVALKEADAIVIVDHENKEMLIGSEGLISASELKELNPGIAVAHICGMVDHASLKRVGIPCCPDIFADSGHMSVTTDYLGPKPIIYLHTAGLKVGEQLAYAKAQGLSSCEAEKAVLKKIDLAKGFT